MNEITHIHLGRESYTISVEAHHELKNYLTSIEKEVADKDVMEEVELRMAELLLEQGVKGDKVILAKDVDYLKEHLGKPEDFSDQADETKKPKDQKTGSKRLFRDSDSAIIAGVSGGIAGYFGIEVALVRIVFVLLTLFGGGSGIVIYLILWLTLPPAVSASEKLQMQGKPVTLESLKESVDKAEISSKAKRINKSVAAVINGLFRLIGKLSGIGMVLIGILVFCAAAVTKTYMLLHNGKLFQENLFPVGGREQWLVYTVLGLIALISVFLILTGVATLKRKWPVRGWVTACLVGVFILGSVASLALGADATPRVRERYETSLHTTAVKDIKPFKKVVTNGDIDIAYISSPNYSVNIHYFDSPDLSKLKVDVKDDTLYIDSSDLDGIKHCTMLCLFPRYDMTVQIYAPNVQDFVTPPKTEIFYPALPHLD